MNADLREESVPEALRIGETELTVRAGQSGQIAPPNAPGSVAV